jgi:hypothetical protein
MQADGRAMPVELVFGNSQAGPYVTGHRLARAMGLVECDVHGLIFRGKRYEPYVQFTGEGARFHPAIAADIRAAIEQLQPTCLVAAIHGADHWIYGLCNDPRPFDFLVPALPQYPLSSGAELIPYDLLLRRFRGDMDWQFGLIRSVMAFCDLPIFHIEAPPPVESADLMLRGIYGDTQVRMEQFGCPSIAFRYKIWWIWTQVTKSICADLGVHFVEGPPETRDANGFLDERYHLDGVHGTDEYGALMVREVTRVKRHLGLTGD